MKNIKNINVLVLGGGGREHAICERLYLSSSIKTIYCFPGNAGIEKIAKIANIDISNFDSISQYCKKNNINLVIPGSEQYLEKGITDYLKLEGISVVGPSKYASLLETSKLFTKKICGIAQIKTAKWLVSNDAKEAKKILKEKKFPLVIKMDSLAAGKGVLVARNLKEANKFLNTIMKGILGNHDSKIIIEECLSGEEASFFFAVDGENAKFLGSAKDYKRVGDGNKGPNTGGMGCISPSPKESKQVIRDIVKEIINPTLKAMKNLGYPFRGFLYAGVMFTKKGIYLIEYNVRLGDPECQAVLARLKTKFLNICLAIKKTNIKNLNIKISKNVSACVVLASKGYPGIYSKEKEITGLNNAKVNKKMLIYHAATKKGKSGKLFTNGGRVLNIVAKEKSIKKALELVYKKCREIYWKGSFYRNDIGS